MKKTIITTITLLIIAAIVGAAIYVVMRFTNNATEPFKNFYYKTDGEYVFALTSQDEFTVGDEITFETGYLVEQALPEGKSYYNAKIVANGGKEFHFKVNGVEKKWSEEVGLDELFKLTKSEKSFKIIIPKAAVSMQHFLEAKYPGQTVTYVPETVSVPYQIVISNYDETTVYTLNFSVKSSISVDLDKPQIVF